MTLFAFLTLKREKKNFKDAICKIIIDYYSPTSVGDYLSLIMSSSNTLPGAEIDFFHRIIYFVLIAYSSLQK